MHTQGFEDKADDGQVSPNICFWLPKSWRLNAHGSSVWWQAGKRDKLPDYTCPFWVSESIDQGDAKQMLTDNLRRLCPQPVSTGGHFWEVIRRMNCLGWGRPDGGWRSTKLTGSLSNRSSISVCPLEEQSSHYSQSLPLFSFNCSCYHLPATPWKDHGQQEENGVCKGRWQSWPLCLLLGVSSELGWGVRMENVLTYLPNPVKPWREVKFTPS